MAKIIPPMFDWATGPLKSRMDDIIELGIKIKKGIKEKNETED